MNQFWDPISIYQKLRTIYFAIIPKNSKAYERTPEFLRTFLKQMYLLNIYYQEWIRRYDTPDESALQSIEETIYNMAEKPAISVLMPVYNPPLEFLKEAIESVRTQMYPYWQLCIADDASTEPGVKELIHSYTKIDTRIQAVYRKINEHISAASNSALKLAKYDTIALLDHDDIIHPLALYLVAHTINVHPDWEIIYSDEDKITKWGRRFDPYFKPEFNYELLLSQNMVSHLGVYKTETMRKIGGFRKGLEGSQDYDLLLRILENCSPDQIHHIPRPLYHWRVSHRSVAEDVSIKPYATKAGIKALEQHLLRKSIKAEVIFLPKLSAYRVEYVLEKSKPHITIIISTPSMSQPVLDCINEIISKTEYPNFNILLCLSSDSDEKVIPPSETWKEIVNVVFSKNSSQKSIVQSLNYWIPKIHTDYICFFSKPITNFSPHWLSELVGQAIQPGIGTVGPKLLYQNGLVYSNGIFLLPDIITSHHMQGTDKDDIGYFGWAKLQRGYSALSEKCLLFKQDHFLNLNGFKEDFINPHFSVVDFCLRLQKQNFRNILCPFVEVSLAETFDFKTKNPAEDLIHPIDKKLMEEHWSEWLENDPSFNPNLDLVEEGKILISLSPRIKEK